MMQSSKNNPNQAIQRNNDKNTSALVWNYPKISESMTFDYSIDSHSSKTRMNKVAHAIMNNFDPSIIKSHRKSSNWTSGKFGISSGWPKKPVLTPKSQSPVNDISNNNKMNKVVKWAKSGIYNFKYSNLDKSKEKVIDGSRNSQSRAATKFSNKIPSCSNLLQAQISQQRHIKTRDHNYTQFLDENKENIHNLRNKMGMMLNNYSNYLSK